MEIDFEKIPKEAIEECIQHIENAFTFQDFQDSMRVMGILKQKPKLLCKMVNLPALIKNELEEVPEYIKLTSPYINQALFENSSSIFKITIRTKMVNGVQNCERLGEIIRIFLGENVIVSFPAVNNKSDEAGVRISDYSMGEKYREILKNCDQKIIDGMKIEFLEEEKEQTTTTQELPPAPVTTRNERTISLMHEGADKAFSILSQRGKSYNHSTPILSYFIHGETDIVYEIHKKIIRIDNSLKAEAEGKEVDERIEDNLIDSINYLLFLYAYRQEKKGNVNNG